MKTPYNTFLPQIGYSLIELVVVIVILGIISVYASPRFISTGEVTLPSQAHKLASDIRHAQVLAITWGKSLRLSIAPGPNGSYSVSCVTTSSSPCNSTPVINPAIGSSFNVVLQKSVVLGGTNSLDFNSLGQPSTAASYTLTSGNSSVTVSVAALTGFVTVSP